jgi:hypothetical protein
MKWVKWMVLLVVAMWVGVVWLTIRIYLPVNPISPYFPSSDTRIGILHWNLGEFQPVYLYSFSNKDNYFIKVAYRGAGQKIELMDVLVGRGGTDSIPFISVAKDDNSVIDIGNIGEYGKYVKIGDRVHITYLRNVLKRPGDFFDIVEPTAENIKDICASSKMLCYSVSLTQANANDFWNFPTTENFPGNLIFPGLSLSQKLLNR